ncbi:MAG TPA: histidinol-phosphatase HisJ [Bacilli bacterium]|nr:histidinol-phosphatase HisJ [Bacilli bacterium]
MIGDYHVHTPFCPHGTNDAWEDYIVKAIEMRLAEISFTEHAPLPRSFTDPVPEKDSAMALEQLEMYFQQGEALKLKYQEQIKINIGLEVDFIEGYEQETRQLLDYYGKRIDDAILSVHMLKLKNGEYVCLDYSEQEFGKIIEQCGSVEAVYQLYYQTVLLAIEADLGSYKPTRMGHLSLVEKFQKKYPSQFDNFELIEQILQLTKTKNYSLDLNTAGLYKPLCQSIYPNQQIIDRALALDIQLKPGSDSHQSTTIARGFDKIEKYFS